MPRARSRRHHHDERAERPRHRRLRGTSHEQAVVAVDHQSRRHGRDAELQRHRRRSHRSRSRSSLSSAGRRDRGPSQHRRRGQHEVRRSRQSRSRDVRLRSPPAPSESMAQFGEAIVKGIDQLVKGIGVGKTPSKVSAISFVNAIDEFNPLTKNVDNWLNTVDEFGHLYNWDNQTICHLALSKLRGPAQVWLEGLPTRIFDWSEWKEMLRQNFMAKRNLHGAIQEMMSCVAEPGQSLYEYCFAKLALIHKLNIPITDADKVNLILGGISDQQLRFSVETANIKDPSVLASHLRSLDGNTVTASSGSTSTVRAVQSGGSRHSQESSAMATVQKESKSMQQCYFCKQRGHYRRDCPQAAKKTEKRAIEYHVNLLGKNPNEKFFKDVILNGHLIKCFVDFGAQCSIISVNATKDLGLKMIPLSQAVALIALTGAELTPQFFVRAELQLDGITRFVEFYVVDQQLMGCEVLVGQNFTELPDVHYNKRGNRLTFTEEECINKVAHTQISLIDAFTKFVFIYPYTVGDLVFVKIPSVAQTETTSWELLPKWRGPFRIVDDLGNDRYEVADISRSTRSQLRYRGAAGVDNLRPWIQYGEA